MTSSTGNFYSSVVHKHHYENPEQAVAVYTDRVVRTLRGFGLTLEDLRGKCVNVPGGPWEALVMHRAGLTVVYNDVDEAAMQAMEALSGGRLVCIRHAASLIPGGTDLIYCVGVLNHVLDPKAFLRDMYRTLAPGGQILISCYRAANRGRQMVDMIRVQMPEVLLEPGYLEDGLGHLPESVRADIIDDLCTPIWRAFHNHEFSEWLEGTGASVELLDLDNDWHENMRVRVARPA